MKIIKAISVGSVAILSLAFSAYFLALTSLPELGRWLDVGELPRHSDFVTSLPGDQNYRPFLAATLINDRLAEDVLILPSEASCNEVDGLTLSTAEIDLRVYQHCGVPKSRIHFLSGRSNNTVTDAEILAIFLARHPLATVTIVTSDYHSRRARWVFRRQLGQLADRVVIISAPSGDFTLNQWWQSEKGFLLVLTEYLKLAAYVIAYGSALWWFIAFLVASISLSWTWRFYCRRNVH